MKKKSSQILTAIFLGTVIVVVLFPAESALARRFTSQAYKKRLQESKIKENLLSFKAGDFEVLTEKELPYAVQNRIALMIENSLSNMRSHFGYQSEGSLQLVLLQGDTYRTIDDPRLATSGFYQDRKIRMSFNFDKTNEAGLKQFERIFRHELTHLVIASLDAGKTPRWLNEGLAVYEAKDRTSRKRGEGRAFYERMEKQGRTPSPETFFGRSATRQYTENTAEFYEHAYILAKYLVDRYGFRNLQTLFQKMKAGASFSTAFNDIYQISLEELAQNAYAS